MASEIWFTQAVGGIGAIGATRSFYVAGKRLTDRRLAGRLPFYKQDKKLTATRRSY